MKGSPRCVCLIKVPVLYLAMRSFDTDLHHRCSSFIYCMCVANIICVSICRSAVTLLALHISRSFLNATGLTNPPPFPSLIFSFLDLFLPRLPRNCFLAQDGSKADLSSVSASGPALHFSILRCPGTEVSRIDIRSRELWRLDQREL